MAVTFTCECGKQLTVESAQRGRKVFCANCRKSIDMPMDLDPGSSPESESSKWTPESAAGPLPENAPTPAEKLKPVTASPAAKKEEEKAADDEPAYEGEIFEPPHLERIKSKDGTEQWKLTCFCEKRILSPLHANLPVGRCPKCGRRLRLPGYRPESKRDATFVHQSKTTVLTPEDIPQPNGAAPPPKPELSLDEKIELASKTFKESERRKKAALEAQPAAESSPVTNASDESSVDPYSEDDVGTIVMEALTPEDLKREKTTNRDAAIQTADRLRRHHMNETASKNAGLISAWPLAGKGPRALAGFVDLTFSTVMTGILVVLAAAEVLPKTTVHPIVLMTAFMTAGILNDGLLQCFGGSIGKRLVVLALRQHNGKRPSLPRIFVRGILKWVLLPGWLMGLVDPAERSLHDLLCGTLVLKGRAR